MYRVSEDPVESLDRAVAMLGTDGLHSLIATVLVQPVFKLAATHYPRFPEIVWEHTFRSASAAENYAAQVENGDPFAAQLLALTMGLGAIVVYRIVVDRSQTLLDGRAPHPAVITSLIESQCAGVAKRVAASWDLSERVLTALEEQRPRRADRASDALAARALAGLRSQARGAGRAARTRPGLRRHGPRFDGPGRHRRRTIRQHLGQTHRPRGSAGTYPALNASRGAAI